MLGQKEEIKIEVNKILEMIYWLYQKEIKAGNINKDKIITSFGKIVKKRNSFKNNGNATLFNYGK